MKVMKRSSRYDNGSRKERNMGGVHHHRVPYTRTLAQTVGGGALVFGSYDKIMNRNIRHQSRQHNNSASRHKNIKDIRRETLVRAASSDVAARSNNDNDDSEGRFTRSGGCNSTKHQDTFIGANSTKSYADWKEHATRDK